MHVSRAYCRRGVVQPGGRQRLRHFEGVDERVVLLSAAQIHGSCELGQPLRSVGGVCERVCGSSRTCLYVRRACMLSAALLAKA